MTRTLAFSLLGFLLVTLLGPLQMFFGMEMVVLDVPLIIVVYMALSDRGAGLGRLTIRISRGRADWTGGITALFLGYFADVLGGGVKGLHCLSLVLVFLFCRGASRHVYLTGTVSIFMVNFFASLASSLISLCVLWLLGSSPGMGSLSIAGVQALLCAATAPLLVKFLRALDIKLMREPGKRGSIV